MQIMVLFIYFKAEIKRMKKTRQNSYNTQEAVYKRTKAANDGADSHPVGSREWRGLLFVPSSWL